MGNREATPDSARAKDFATALNVTTKDTQYLRLIECATEFFSFPRNLQLDLADAAIVWAMASIANLPNSADCEAYLYSITDTMYSVSDHATRTLTPREREQIFVAARQVKADLESSVVSALSASYLFFQQLPDKDVRRFGFDVLSRTKATYLAHAEPTQLGPAIVHCVVLCRELDLMKRGVKIDPVALLITVIKDMQAIEGSILEALKRGILVVRSGKIVKK